MREIVTKIINYTHDASGLYDSNMHWKNFFLLSFRCPTQRIRARAGQHRIGGVERRLDVTCPGRSRVGRFFPTVYDAGTILRRNSNLQCNALTNAARNSSGWNPKGPGLLL